MEKSKDVNLEQFNWKQNYRKKKMNKTELIKKLFLLTAQMQNVSRHLGEVDSPEYQLHSSELLDASEQVNTWYEALLQEEESD